jgi:hypothetical protein
MLIGGLIRLRQGFGGQVVLRSTSFGGHVVERLLSLRAWQSVLRESVKSMDKQLPDNPSIVETTRWQC